SRDYFFRHPDRFFAFYRAKMLYPGALPNAAHQKLAQWEAEGREIAVITQNIDGLHQAAGSKNVVELHGSALRNRCVGCGRGYGVEKILEGEGVPRCECGSIIKPDVVLYGEMLDEEAIDRAVDALARADLVIVAGTSLTVYPAAGLIGAYRGDRLALINRAPTPIDERAALLLRGSVGQVMAALP
ncbi:MAG: NAD-dependent protein deacylase, partial [Clostridiales bacterium]|nr:NAD-dependent protein deacylase [Clostridiales bacterium]